MENRSMTTLKCNSQFSLVFLFVRKPWSNLQSCTHRGTTCWFFLLLMNNLCHFPICSFINLLEKSCQSCQFIFIYKQLHVFIPRSLFLCLQKSLSINCIFLWQWKIPVFFCDYDSIPVFFCYYESIPVFFCDNDSTRPRWFFVSILELCVDPGLPGFVLHDFPKLIFVDATKKCCGIGNSRQPL